jgi:hypothetical protein
MEDHLNTLFAGLAMLAMTILGTGAGGDMPVQWSLEVSSGIGGTRCPSVLQQITEALASELGPWPPGTVDESDSYPAGIRRPQPPDVNPKAIPSWFTGARDRAAGREGRMMDPEVGSEVGKGASFRWMLRCSTAVARIGVLS